MAGDQRLRAEALAAGRRPAALLREAAFACLEKKPLLPAGTDAALAALTREVRRIGTNINQLARLANAGQASPPAALIKAAALLAELEDAPARYFSILSSPLPHGDQVLEPAHA